MKAKSDKINQFRLQHQFPDILKVPESDRRSGNSSSLKFSTDITGFSSAIPAKQSVSKRIVTAVDHVTQLRLESCRCPHLQEYLPHLLDLKVCRTTPNLSHQQGWSVANPVHALHMVASQFGVESSSKTQKQRFPPTFIYGEEQQRTVAIQTEGIAEYWYPFDGKSPGTIRTRHQQINARSLSRIAPKTMTTSSKYGQNSMDRPRLLSPQRMTPSTNNSTSEVLRSALILPQKLDAAISSTVLPKSHPTNIATNQIQEQKFHRTSNFISTTTSALKTGSVQQTYDGKGALFPCNTAFSSIKEGNLPSATDPSQVVKFNPDVVFNSKIEVNQDSRKMPSSLRNSGVGNTGKDTGGSGITSATTYQATVTSINDTSATRDFSSDKQFLSSDNDQPSTLSFTEGIGNKNQRKEIKMKKCYKQDTSLLRLPELTIGSTDASVQDKHTTEDIYCSDDQLKKKNENVETNKTESSHKEKPAICQSLDKNAASTTTIAIGKIVEEIKTTSKELHLIEHEVVGTTLSELANRSQNSSQLKADVTVKQEDCLRRGPTDSSCKIKYLSRDTILSEVNEHESNKESLPLKRMEARNAVIISKKSCDAIVPNNHFKPKITTDTLCTSLKVYPMEIDEAIIQDGDVKKNRTRGPKTSENNQKIADVSFESNTVQAGPIILPTEPHSGRMATVEIDAAGIKSNIQSNEQLCQQFFTMSYKSDPCFEHFRREEEKIRRTRRSLMLKRARKKCDSSAREMVKKKRKVSEKPNVMSGWKILSTSELSLKEEDGYIDASHTANQTVERWIHQFRLCHESFWNEKVRDEIMQKQQNPFSLRSGSVIVNPCCLWCNANDEERSVCRPAKSLKKLVRPFTGDELMRCLDCGFIGCSPPSLNSKTKHHIQKHLLISGHKFAVSCGEKAQLFCLECGDCVYHEAFEQEKIRILCANKSPYMAWKEHAVLRSFDPFQFTKTPDNGILWRGLVATYPPLVPKEHFCAVQLILRRQALFEGNSLENWILPKSNALHFAASQCLRRCEERFKINAPIGIYNLGNTCFISTILQCLVFCKPLQQYFLRDSGHHFKSCEVFRHKEDVLVAAAAAASAGPVKRISAKSKKPGNLFPLKKTSKIESEVCIACEMDRLFLCYYGGTTGNDVCVPIEESSQHLLPGYHKSSTFPLDDVAVRIEKGDPLIISDFLTSAWKSGGMNHLMGYDQHDAHEFLDSFLDVLGMHIAKFRNRVHTALTKVDTENAFLPDNKKSNVVKSIFGGSLRSVLLCDNCGVKRIQEEPFMNISLSIPEEVGRMKNGKDTPINIETCLQNFVFPEVLGDLVHCNSCGKKTRTKKQHTFAKLPRVLCLHLKRFDATKNKKIENFVSFPSYGLNMGMLLSHWCEVTGIGSPVLGRRGSVSAAEPRILYNLFGTVNHKGNMQSGHYVANVKVDNAWYHCNDQHISHAREESVLRAEGAYLLFYIRQ